MEINMSLAANQLQTQQQNYSVAGQQQRMDDLGQEDINAIQNIDESEEARQDLQERDRDERMDDQRLRQQQMQQVQQNAQPYLGSNIDFFA
ncbi:hypothetical protein [Salisediminibacterium beveridgei]|uniref:Uncharacterized protein n=1 Tax=Salisediminibacterium beveridgei TaxID=632773 RepID=A0A1D7QSG4_9BACI|nr:hypothetical protein [Salisediminibacterium beveridgei]AOM81921.1 hypothetical protein BBEV_0528 [Salisediminibacterium beveridgei]